MNITGTMRWALEQSLREVLEKRGCKYGSAAYESVLNNSIALCEKTNGDQGVRESTLLAALRIACTTIDRERDKTPVTGEDGQRRCGTCAFWSSSAGATYGRCTAPAPEWVTRENDTMNQFDGLECTLWQK